MDNKIKERDLSALAEYQRQLWNKPKLKYLFFELTDKCNLSCQHCGSKCTNRNSTFLPLEIANKVLHSVYAEYGTEDIMICITGGEPLLHPDLFDVIRLAKDMGFAVGMTTNGTLINRKNAALPAVSFSISHAMLQELDDKAREYLAKVFIKMIKEFPTLE